MPNSRPCLPRLTLKQKYWFEREGQFAVGEGGIELLRAIRRTGSLAAAAESVGWSYRHAWGYLRRAEGVLEVSLTEQRAGKGKRRGLNLTAHGAALVSRADRAKTNVANGDQAKIVR
jgi:molybdate transport system regulatory protein